MPEQINSSADLWVTVEADIAGANSAKTAANSGAASTQPSLMVGTYNASLPTLTNGTAGALQIDSNGRLIIGASALPSKRVFVSDLTLDTNVYASGDTLGDILEITNAVLSSAGTGTLQTITVIDDDDQGQPLDLVFFSQSVTVGTKNSAWAVSDADMANALGIVRVESADFVDLGGNRIATITPPPIGLQPAIGTSIFVGTISRGSGTYTASGLRLVITIERDG